MPTGTTPRLFPIGDDGVMDESWTSMAVTEVRTGDRVRAANGQEVLVSRIEPAFLGLDGMVALIEDTATRWFKMPVATAAEVEVQRGS